ncbi:uncharacterized protein [Ambystoma mexicanum]|uniref:uncharacterized protein isoform X2 n=1 Tax=Ambystoma mexicanum TaxID=8296 RepID=UPI0037E95C98
MSEQVSHRLSIAFSDVAAYFYEEEWDLLEVWQKQLYKNVMKEIHKALISMGYKIANPDIVFRIKDEGESYITNSQVPEKRRCLQSTKSSDPVFNPDMSIWIKQVEEPHYSNRTIVGRRSTNEAVVAHSTSVPHHGFRMKMEEGTVRTVRTSEGRQNSIRGPLMNCEDGNADLSLCIKQEEESFPMKFQGARKVETFHVPISVSGARLQQMFANERPIVEEKEAKNTQILIKTSLAIFKYYLRARHLDLKQVEQYNKNQLNRILCMFYAGMRKPNGDYYAKKSITSFRYGLQRHFAQLKGIDILHDPAFRDANTTMAAMLARMKSEGRAYVQHKEPLSKEDFKKLYESCDINTPAGLQHKVFIDLMLHLCSRGREKLREFNKDEFQIAIDSGGHKYVSARRNRLSQDCRELMQHDRGPRMYEMKGNPKCPVLSFEKYIMKLHPGHSAFWQRPKLTTPSNSSPWYSNTPVGKNTLGNYMKNLSQDYGLSRLYTNHCLRVTCNMALVDLCMVKTGL